jgi:CopG family nickel-responsive transcriptional regulator
MPKDLSQRISLSLPGSLVKDIDRIADHRGFPSRSAAIADMLRQATNRHDAMDGSAIMAGTISIVYQSMKNNCQLQLVKLQRKHIAEVISSLHIQLEDHHVMEVMVVQGPAKNLKNIADEFISCRGVKTGKLTLTSVIMPPLYSRG